MLPVPQPGGNASPRPYRRLPWWNQWRGKGLVQGLLPLASLIIGLENLTRILRLPDLGSTT